jgi:hypothetical protein
VLDLTERGDVLLLFNRGREITVPARARVGVIRLSVCPVAAAFL